MRNDERNRGLTSAPGHPNGCTYSRPLGSRLRLYWARLETAVIGILVGGALALVFYTVALRFFVPRHAPLYTEEVTVYAVMWGILLACGRVSRRSDHVRSDLIIQFMSVRVQRWAEVAANLAGVAFAGFLAYFGGRVAYEAWFFGDLSPTLLRFPLWIYYGALPTAAALIGVGHLLAAIDLARGTVGPSAHMHPAD